MSGTIVALDNGTVATGVVVFNQDGSVSGEKTARSRISVLGRCGDVDNVLRTVWDGPTALYAFPAAAIQMQVVSTSASDAALGTNIRKVEIHYLDTDFNQKVESITMAGLTPVLTVAKNILRVNSFYAIEVGTNQIAAGTISLQAVGGAITYSLIVVGRNLSRVGVFTVPAGYEIKIDQWQLSSGAVTGTHFTQMTLLGSNNDETVITGLLLPKDEQGTLNGGLAINYINPIIFPPKTDISMVVISDAGSANVIALGTFTGSLQAI